MQLDFLSEIGTVFTKYITISREIINLRNDPDDISQAKKELDDPVLRDYIASSITLSISLREIVADNLMGIQRLLINPIMTYAPFVLYRGLVEVSALSLWLCSTKINATERANRYFIYRYNSLVEQEKFLISEEQKENCEFVRQNMEKLKITAENKGLSIFNGIRRDIVRKMPSKTQIINDMLDAESVYRLFSAISHGQHWAIIQSSFKKVRTGIDIFDGVKGGIIEKNIEPIAVLYLCRLSILHLTKLEIEQFIYFGWDEKPLIELLIDTDLQIKQISETYNIQVGNFKP